MEPCLTIFHAMTSVQNSVPSNQSCIYIRLSFYALQSEQIKDEAAQPDTTQPVSGQPPAAPVLQSTAAHSPQASLHSVKNVAPVGDAVPVTSAADTIPAEDKASNEKGARAIISADETQPSGNGFSAAQQQLAAALAEVESMRQQRDDAMLQVSDCPFVRSRGVA